MSDRLTTRRVLVILALFGVLAVIVMPWVWALLSSFKPRSEIMSTGFLPSEWLLDNYFGLFRDTLFVRWMFNSAVVSLSAAFLAMGLCGLAGYGFAKFDFPAKETLFLLVVASVSIPPFTSTTSANSTPARRREPTGTGEGKRIFPVPRLTPRDTPCTSTT